MADDLTRWLEGRPILARPVSRTRKAWQWCRRNPSLAALGGVLAGLLLVMLTGLGFYTGHIRSLSNEVNEKNRQLRESVKQLDAAVIDRTQSQRLAEERARELSEAVYSMEVSSAADAWRRNDAIVMRDALEPYLKTDRQVGDLREFGWHYLWQQQTVREIFRKSLPLDQYSAAFSPDGGLVAFAGADSIARIFNVQDGQLIREFNTKQKELNCVVFGEKGDWLGTAGDDGSICLWNWPGCQLRYRSPVFVDQQAFQLAYVPSLNELVVCGNSTELKILDFNNGKLKAQLTGQHSRSIENFAISPDETKVMTCGADSLPMIWTLKDRKAFQSNLLFDAPISCASWTMDSRYALVGATDGMLRVFDAVDDDVVAEHQFPDGVQSMTRIASQRFLVGDRAGAVSLISLSSQPDSSKLKITVLNRWALHQHRIYGLTIGPRRQLFATASRDHQVGVFRPSNVPSMLRRKFFETKTRIGKYHVAGPDQQGRTYRVSPTGLAIFRGDADTPEQDILLKDVLCNLKLHGHELLAGTVQGELLTWDISGAWKEPLRQKPDGNRPIGEFEFLDHDRLLIPDAGTSVSIWNRRTRKIEKTFLGHHALAVDRDRKTFVLAKNQGHELVLYNAATLTPLWSAKGHTATIPAIRFGTSGRYLYSGGTDRSLRIWDVATGRELRQFRGNERAINTIAISPDERTIAAGEVDGGIHLWDARTGRLLYQLAKLDDSVLNLEFTSDGKELIAHDARMIEYRWSAQPDETVLKKPASSP